MDNNKKENTNTHACVLYAHRDPSIKHDYEAVHIAGSPLYIRTEITPLADLCDSVAAARPRAGETVLNAVWYTPSDASTPVNVTELAGVLYEGYCKDVGGAAFNGDDLPTWAEFYGDASKDKQSSAWVGVAVTAFNQLSPLSEQAPKVSGDTAEVRVYDRILQETRVVAGNLNKLNTFMASEAFPDIDREAKDLLYEQQRAMSTYVQILGKRLEIMGRKFSHS